MMLFSFFLLTMIFSSSIGKYLLVDLDSKQEVNKDPGKTIKANKNKDLILSLKKLEFSYINLKE